MRANSTSGSLRSSFAAATLVIALASPLPAQAARVIDDFSSLAAWTAVPSDGVSLKLVPTAGAMRMDVDFHGGGYALSRGTTFLVYRYQFQ